jgi:iron(III) transport system ATP-binding protein
MEALANRDAPLLSGGQQQRVALARALVYEPSVLLLDEPLSNLDAKLRLAMRTELLALIKQLDITTLYVTHDQEEALALSDRIAVMQDGLVQQEGRPRDIYAQPASPQVAAFVGHMNFFPGIVEETSADGLTVACELGRLACAATSEAPAPGEPVWLTIRPEDVVLHQGAPCPTANAFPAQVVRTLFGGSRSQYELQFGSATCQVETDGRSGLAVGAAVHVELPPDRLHLFLRPTAETTERVVAHSA